MKFLKLFLFIGLAISFAMKANAQSSLHMELEQLREDVIVLQRQLYREQQDGISPASAQDVAVKITQFDEDLRQAVGKIDEVEYKIKMLKERRAKEQTGMCFNLH